MKHRHVALALMASVLSAGTVLAESVWVKSETAEVRSGKGAVYPVVASPRKGAELPVVAREGKWIKVQINPQTQGYIFENSISSDKISGGGGNLLGAVTDKPSEMSTGAAAKGLEQSAETYAHDKNLDPAIMQWLVDLRKGIQPQEWDTFTAQGKVGPHKP